MKKVVLTIVCFISVCLLSYAQEIEEPDFTGEVLVVKDGESLGILEKNTVKVKTKAGASVYLTGIGSVKSRITVEGCCAKRVLKSSDDFKFVIKAVDNNTDPIAVISIFKFDEKKNERRAEVSSASTFGGGSSNNLNYVEFSAKKYGTSSYLITLNEKQAGQYGITVKNPNALDEKNLIVSSFAIEN
ncbi:MAG: hypothetical protein LBP63_08850 [Prevotellaceae bacterium]|jgi:hypothetical protein|nr:hypothetical protein [Prevotellaceae bacterium]